MTAQEVIERGMRLLGVLESGGTPTTAELADGLEVLNSLCAFWGSQSWCPPAQVQDSKVLTAADGVYTIGVGQDINTALPTKIVSAYLRDSDGFDTPLQIVSQADFARIRDKDYSAEPEALCFVRAGTTGTIYLWPVPDAADTLYIESYKVIGNYALSDAIGLPTEYERPLCAAFAVDFALEFQIEVSPTLGILAGSSLDQLKSVAAARNVTGTVTDTIGICKQSRYNPYRDE